MTPEGLQHLASLPALDFLDARGTGAPRAMLAPLARRFGLLQPQAGVLARSHALAAAAAGGGLFPCGCAAGGAAFGAPPRAGAAAEGPVAAETHARAASAAAGWLGDPRAGAGVVRAPRAAAAAVAGAGGGGAAHRAACEDADALAARGIVALLRA